MSIWTYEDAFPAPTEADVTRESCPFCESEVDYISTIADKVLKAEIRLCHRCGWWCRNERYRIQSFNEFEASTMLRHNYSMEGICAQLRNLDLADITIPLNDVRNYLIIKYNNRFDVAPRKLEELVASVFRDYGYNAEVTAYQKDGGIDVILSKNNENIGVQVKRYKNSIEAEQIRSFAGALILGDHPSGIFMTTSVFRSGAVDAAQRFTSRGIPIELIDAKRFYDALKLRQKTDLSKDNLEEFVYSLQAIGESKTTYEDEGPY